MTWKNGSVIAVTITFLISLGTVAFSVHARATTNRQPGEEIRPAITLDAEPTEPLEFVDQIGGRMTALEIQGDYLYVGVGPRLVILDVSDPTNPQRVGQTDPLPGAIERLSVQDKLVFTANGEGGLRIIDVENPGKPQEIGFYPGTISDVEVDGDVVFLASTIGLISLDVSDPTSPQQLDFLDVSSPEGYIAIDNDVIALVADWHGFWTIDVSNPVDMQSLAYVEISDSHLKDLVAAEGFLYIAVTGNPFRGCRSGWISIYDISDPVNPQVIGGLGTGEEWGYLLNNGLAYSDGHLYVVSEPGLYIISVLNPSDPTLEGLYDVSFSMAVVADDNYAYVSSYSQGIETIDVHNPSHASKAGTYAVLPALSRAPNIAFDDSYLYVSDKVGFSILKSNQNNQLHVIGAFHDSDQLNGNPLDYQTNYVYLGGGSSSCGTYYPPSSSLRVIDVNNKSDPSQVGFFGECCEGPVSIVEAYEDHTFIIAEYVSAIDVSVPSAPSVVDQASCDFGPHDMDMKGDILYMTGSVQDLCIFDVGHPNEIELIGQYKSEDKISYVYVHNQYAWLTVQKKNPTSYELNIVNVETPTNPVKVGTYETSNPAEVIDIIDDEAYVAEDSALLVLDISDPLHPNKIASYETIGRATRVQKIDSHLHIYIADNERGLWVFRPEITVTPRTISSQQTTNPPTIDGDLSDWPATDGTILDLPTARNVSGIRPSSADVSASIRSLWTESTLYFAVEVIDNELVADSVKVWEDDAIEVALDALHDHLPGGVDDHQYTTTLDGRTADFGSPDNSYIAAVHSRIDGWDVEVAIPVGNFGLGSFNEGDIMGLNLAVIDDDTGGDFDSYLLWESDRTWETMPDWGQLRLVSELTIQIPATPSVTPTSTPVGDTITFQEGFLGYSGAEDTSINQWNPDVNYGDSDTLTIRGDGAIGTLLQYDLSSLPEDVAIKRATLSLYPQDRSNPQALSASVYPLLRSWIEAQATWEQASNGNAWKRPGADGAQDREYVAADYWVTDWLEFWASFDITSLVQRWVDGRLANNGVVIKQQGGPAVGYDFPSKDVAGWEHEPYHPELIVSYWNATPTSTPTATPSPTPTSTHTITPTSTPLCIDEFEPDDSWQQAKLIYLDVEPQQHNFHQPGDIDYVKFGITVGTELTLYTNNLGSGVDTTLTLYNTDGVTQLAYNDIDPTNPPASRIDWTAPASGTYFLKAAHFNPEAGGCDMTYELAVARVTPTPTPTLLPLYLPMVVQD